MRVDARDFDDPTVINVWDRIWRDQRLPIHEARHEADLWSRAVPAKPASRNLLVVRGER